MTIFNNLENDNEPRFSPKNPTDPTKTDLQGAKKDPTDELNRVLSENTSLLRVMQDCQKAGNLNDLVKYQHKMHRNLVYLATLAEPIKNLPIHSPSVTKIPENTSPKPSSKPATPKVTTPKPTSESKSVSIESSEKLSPKIAQKVASELPKVPTAATNSLQIDIEKEETQKPSQPTIPRPQMPYGYPPRGFPPHGYPYPRMPFPGYPGMPPSQPPPNGDMKSPGSASEADKSKPTPPTQQPMQFPPPRPGAPPVGYPHYDPYRHYYPAHYGYPYPYQQQPPQTNPSSTTPSNSNPPTPKM